MRSRLCPPELFDLTELVEAADDKLFQLSTLQDNHILYSLWPPKSDSRYNLRKKNIITENHYRKTLICLIAIGYFMKTVINYSSCFLTTVFYILTQNSI